VEHLSVVIPTYNECRNIRILIPQIQRVFSRHQIDGEIIVVDDQSSDGTQQALEEICKRDANLRVRFREPPRSIARAWYEGFEMASKENIVCIDADLCHDPEYFPEMLRALTGCDMVIGSRYMYSRTAMMENKSILKVYASALARYLTRIATGFRETDTSHSFRMFKREVFTAVKDHLQAEGNVFLIELLIHTKRCGFEVREIPIEYGKRVYGETKLKVSREGVRYLKFIAQTWPTRFR